MRQVIRQTDAAHISRSIKKKKRIEEKKDDDDDVEAEREREAGRKKMMIFFFLGWGGGFHSTVTHKQVKMPCSIHTQKKFFLSQKRGADAGYNNHF